MDYNATKTALDLSMATNDYNFLMGLSGLLIGAFICFFVLYAIATIAKGF